MRTYMLLLCLVVLLPRHGASTSTGSFWAYWRARRRGEMHNVTKYPRRSKRPPKLGQSHTKLVQSHPILITRKWTRTCRCASWSHAPDTHTHTRASARARARTRAVCKRSSMLGRFHHDSHEPCSHEGRSSPEPYACSHPSVSRFLFCQRLLAFISKETKRSS